MVCGSIEFDQWVNAAYAQHDAAFAYDGFSPAQAGDPFWALFFFFLMFAVLIWITVECIKIEFEDCRQARINFYRRLGLGDVPK